MLASPETSVQEEFGSLKLFVLLNNTLHVN